MVTLDESAMTWSAPEGQRAGRPLLLALHGHNGDEQQLAVSSVLLPRELVVVTPRAPFREPGGWSWFELAESGRDAAAQVTTELLHWLDRQTGYTSVGLLGLSQGAAMALSLLRRDPARFAYVVQLSGFAIDTSPDPGLARLRPPAFSAHGDLDTVIPPERAADTARWLREHTTLTEKRYPGLGHSVAPQEVLDVSQFISAQLHK
ncbi:dienelactone hydrolase family protein [soil metagenome]